MQFYRYKDILTTLGVNINLSVFKLVKETDKGYWISPTWDHREEYKKWVSKNGKNRYAYPTKEEALFNFQKRKERQIKILEAKLITARSALRSALSLSSVEEYERRKQNA